MSGRRRPRRAGFTLIELMAVVTIIALLGTAVTLAVGKHIIDSRIAMASTNLETLRRAVEMHRLDTGRLPERIEGLWARPGAGNARLWKGPYVELTNGQPRPDPWGNPFVYRRVGSSYELSSLGADGAPGGTDEDADVVLSAGAP